MEGESSGVQQAQGQVGQGENQRQGGQEPDVDAQGEQKQDQQEPQEDTVSGSDGTDYAAQLTAKDAEIEALQAKVAEAAKTAEATERLGKEIADLKARLTDERTEFALRSAGARSVTAAKALLAEHDGDVEALVKAEPWLFDAGAPGKGGATGLEPAGASGGSDDQYMRRWERIAGLADEGKE
jgi:dsDNA-specific endonuclease/ATPase MutS2